MGKRKPTSFTIDEDDMARLEEIGARLEINKSRAVSFAINMLHNLMEKSFPTKEAEPKTYAEVVLSSERLKPEAPKIETETALKPEAGRKRGGWPKGKPRKPVLRVVMGRAHEQSN